MLKVFDKALLITECQFYLTGPHRAATHTGPDTKLVPPFSHDAKIL